MNKASEDGSGEKGKAFQREGTACMGESMSGLQNSRQVCGLQGRGRVGEVCIGSRQAPSPRACRLVQKPALPQKH